MENLFNLDEKLLKLDSELMPTLTSQFAKIDEITEYNQNKVLKAFVDNRVSESSFGGSTGYGYDDVGRETIERVFAQITGSESSLFRHNFVSGTHALTVALFGVLRPNDTVVSITGRPYDTILGVFGVNDGHGNLKEFGVSFEEIALKNGKMDKDAILARVKKSFVKVAYIQRSRGYTLRPSLLVEEIGDIAKEIREVSPDTIIMVDNCYGEFVQTKEPTQCGADLIIGSLIKNAGGGIAPTGGYIAGRSDLVEKCACRLTAPGIGGEVGATLGQSRALFMGLFQSPHVTGEALKTAVYSAKLYETLGFEVSPSADAPRGDIIQSVTLGNPNALVAFCQGMQKGAPVDAYVTPEPWDMPGYDSKVIMAAGAFTLGASIELSADAPMREPYAAWMQGGLNFHSAKTGVLLATQSMLDKGFIHI